MKEQFKEQPEKTWVEEISPKKVILHFSENIEKQTRENEKGETEEFYEADTYAVEAVARDGILEEVEANRDAWLAAAKEKETHKKNQTLYERVQDLESTVKNQNDAINDIIVSTLTV